MKICSVESCISDASHDAGGRRGFCRAHYLRAKRNGSPTAGRVPPGELLRFINEVALKYSESDCLVWPHGKKSGGYGALSVDGCMIGAHRYICILAHGAAPEALFEAAHGCGNSGCVNPNHLSWKTRIQNKADELIHGTRNFGGRNGMSKLTEQQVRAILSLKGKKDQKEIAAEFGVGTRAISKIHTGLRWAWMATSDSPTEQHAIDGMGGRRL